MFGLTCSKNSLKVLGGLSFQGLPSFISQEKLAKCSNFPGGCCFTNSPLIFATQNLTILLHATFCISLFGQSLWTLSITKFHLKFPTYSASYFMEILKRKSWVNIVICFSFIKHQNPFFHLAKTAKIQIYNTSAFVMWSCWPFCEAFKNIAFTYIKSDKQS